MIQIRVKILAGMGDPSGKSNIVNFDEFLTQYSPQLRACVSVSKQFPPFHILNEELLSGGRDLGMSGGYFWKPFKLTKEEYLEIREEMLTNPKLDLDYDPTLEEKPKISKRCGAIRTKYNPRKKKK